MRGSVAAGTTYRTSNDNRNPLIHESRMILPVHDRLRGHLAGLLTSLYSLDGSAQPTLALEYPPNRDLGDLGTPVAFELARRLRKPPRAIAQEIAAASARSKASSEWPPRRTAT